MVVAYLDQFIRSKVPGGAKMVNILEEIKKHKEYLEQQKAPCPVNIHEKFQEYEEIKDLQAHEADPCRMLGAIRRHRSQEILEPLIYIDLSSCLGQWQTRADILVGYRPWTVCERFLKFFRQLKEAGATLFFFEKGIIEPAKEEAWLARQERRYRDMIKIFDAIQDGKEVHTILAENHDNRTLRESPLILRLLRSVIFDEKLGHYKRVMDGDYNKVLSSFATATINTLAVFSDDSDFLIHSAAGKWKWWSVKELDEEDFTTCQLDVDAFKAALNLHEHDELKLFATLLGNDILRMEYVHAWHRRLRTDIFRGIAQKVPQLLTLLYEEGTVRCIVDTLDTRYPKVAEAIEESLIAFGYSHMDWSRQVYKEDKVLWKQVEDPLHYHFMKRFPLWCDVRFDDQLKYEHKNQSFNYMAKDIKSRQMGIYLGDKNETHVEIYTKFMHDAKFMRHAVPIIYPEIEDLPKPQEIICRDEFMEHDLLRNKLFMWILKDSFNNMYLNHHNFPVVATLCYLIQESLFNAEDASLFLYSYQQTRKETWKLPETLELPAVLNRKAFWQCHMFLNMYDLVCDCMCTVGHKNYLVRTVFDPVHYHRFYLEYQEMDACTRISTLNEVSKWTSIISHCQKDADKLKNTQRPK